MAGRFLYEWPEDDEELVRLVHEAGGREKAAEIMGCSRGALDHQLTRRKLRDRVIDEAPRTKLNFDHTSPISEEEKLRQRVAELESALNARRKENTFEERVLDRLEAAAKVKNPTPIPRPRRREMPRSERGAHEFALLFSDTHAGEIVEPEAVLGMNDYRWTVLLERMSRIRESVISYQEHRAYPVKKLNIWMLGDMLSGDIHEELQITNEMPSEEATVQFAYDTSEWLEGFLEHFEEVSVRGIPGNHPRKSRKPASKNAYNNSDWTAYRMIEMYHRKTERIDFEFPKAAFLATTVAQNYRTLLMHGDGIRSTMPGVPWGGVVRRITVLEQQFAAAKMPLDYVSLGHFHTANSLDGIGVRSFLNGSVKGVDEHSLKNFGSGRRPSQLLLTFHRDRGWTDTSSIDCEDTLPASSPATLP